MTHGGFRSLRSLHPCLPGRAGTTSSAGASSPSLALGSLSPSGFSRAAAGGLLVLSCRRPLRGALVRCGGVSVSGARRWRACGPFRVGYSLARNLWGRCVLSALVRAPGARGCDCGVAISRRPLGCCGCGGLAAVSSPPARPLRRVWQPRGRPVSARSPAPWVWVLCCNETSDTGVAKFGASRAGRRGSSRSARIDPACVGT